MNRHTRKKWLNIAAGIAVATAAIVVLLPAVQAAPGTITGNVNVRSGPGTEYGIVDTVRRGQQVDVEHCQGSWCHIAKPGADGWVSANYLSAGGRSVDPAQPGLSFDFSFGGPDGPSVNFGVGQQPRPQPQPEPPVVTRRPPPVSQACFFENRSFRGASFCLDAGEGIRDLGDWADRISSLDNPDGLSVQLCSESNYRRCRTYTTSARSLGEFDDYVISVRLR